MSGLVLRAVRLALIAGTFLTVSFTQASAAEQAAAVEQSDEQLASHEVAAKDSNDTLLTAAATDAELDSSRGAFLPSSLNIANVQQEAQSSGNVVIGGMTGANIIGAGSFTNTQGLVNVIQNSGNNVIIQSSTVVNMTFSK